MNEARYHFRAYDVCTPPAPTNDVDEALIATAMYPVDVWDIEQERFLSPIDTETEYREVLYRVNEKRRRTPKLKIKWGNVALTLFIIGVTCYCGYVLLTSPLEP